MRSITPYTVRTEGICFGSISSALEVRIEHFLIKTRDELYPFLQQAIGTVSARLPVFHNVIYDLWACHVLADLFEQIPLFEVNHQRDHRSPFLMAHREPSSNHPLDHEIAGRQLTWPLQHLIERDHRFERHIKDRKRTRLNSSHSQISYA